MRCPDLIVLLALIIHAQVYERRQRVAQIRGARVSKPSTYPLTLMPNERRSARRTSMTLPTSICRRRKSLLRPDLRRRRSTFCNFVFYIPQLICQQGCSAQSGEGRWSSPRCPVSSSPRKHCRALCLTNSPCSAPIKRKVE